MSPPGHRAGQVFAEVAKLQGLIRAVLISCGAPIERIDDLVQDCMLVAWRAIQEGRFNPPDPERPLPDAVGAWLSGIASRLAIDARRSRTRYERTFQATETTAHPIDFAAISAPDVERVMIAREELRVIEGPIVQKTFPTSPRPEAGRYEPARNPLMTKRRVFGVPDMREAGTSHVERGNLTIRMQIRRFTRLCNGFSKKLENHRAAVSLHMAFYNFVRMLPCWVVSSRNSVLLVSETTGPLDEGIPLRY